jgi:hypothetical protein
MDVDVVFGGWLVGEEVLITIKDIFRKCEIPVIAFADVAGITSA